MQGFTKLQFNDSGSAVAVACPLCGKATCFCNRDLATAPLTSLPNTTAAPSASRSSIHSGHIHGTARVWKGQAWLRLCVNKNVRAGDVFSRAPRGHA